MITYEKARIRVARGAAWLDEHRPDWWRTDINLEILNLRNGDNCIIGQVFKEPYHHGAVFGKPRGFNVNLEHTDFNVDHGFFAYGNNLEDYSILQECWVDLICGRLNEPPVVQWTHREAVDVPS